MNYTKADALKSLDTTAKWNWIGEDYSGITWDASNSGTKPTESEIDAELTRLQNQYTANEYQRKRAAEYPSVVDQLDDIYHNGLDAWKATIKVTKDKYPKP